MPPKSQDVVAIIAIKTISHLQLAPVAFFIFLSSSKWYSPFYGANSNLMHSVQNANASL